MPRFRLLAGRHIQSDWDRPIDETTGRRPTRTYCPGDIVEHPTVDLAKLLGTDKFARLPDDAPLAGDAVTTQTKRARRDAGIQEDPR